jgi:hypothetical protein
MIRVTPISRLRAKIAQRVSPENVTLMAQDIGPLHPLRPDAPLLALNPMPQPSAAPTSVAPESVAPARREVVTVPQPQNAGADAAPHAAPAPGKNRKPATRKPTLPGHVADSRVAVQPHGARQ